MLALLVVGAACANGATVATEIERPAATVGSTTRPSTSTTSSTTTSTSTTTTIAPTTTAPTTTASTAVPADTTTAPPTSTLPPAPPAADPTFAATAAAFEPLVSANAGASLSIARGGILELGLASGTTIGGDDATSDSPMVVASVSKLLVALTAARLDDFGALDIDAPVDWAGLGLSPDPAWDGTTIRQLLDHTTGMPVVRTSWFTGNGTCADVLPGLLDRPPDAGRGEWRYSNGNYCAAGLAFEAFAGVPAATVVDGVVFQPLGLDGLHSTLDGLPPDAIAYPNGVERLSRLGGAGTFVASTDDLALAFSGLSDHDLSVLRPPAVFDDQYGIGHTGTVDGAKSCVWILQAGATVVAVTIAGDSVATGGALCDRILPALATDLGLPSERPDRWP